MQKMIRGGPYEIKYILKVALSSSQRGLLFQMGTNQGYYLLKLNDFTLQIRFSATPLEAVIHRAILHSYSCSLAWFGNPALQNLFLLISVTIGAAPGVARSPHASKITH